MNEKEKDLRMLEIALDKELGLYDDTTSEKLEELSESISAFRSKISDLKSDLRWVKFFMILMGVMMFIIIERL